MLLSILIPTHDYNAYPLVQSLHQQAEALSVPYEMILVEDGSHDSVSMIANLKTQDLSRCRYIRRKENVGRSAIRNFLMDESKGDWLLFMDADGKVVRKDFLQKYVDAARQYDVVCGGVVHPDEWHDPERMLRWKYEKAYERQHGTISEQFRSFSFLISRSVAQKVRFDERYKGYGYEDVQFGKDLMAAGFMVHGIDNPLMNNDIEDNATFLRKTEEALWVAHHFKEDIGDLVKMNRLSTRYRLFSPLIRVLYRLSAPLLRRNLLSGNPNLLLFGFYKLGYYSTL